MESIDQLPDLIAEALSADEERRWKIVRELHYNGSTTVLDAAVELCLSSEMETKRLGADILGQLGIPERTDPERAIAVLLSLLTPEQEPNVIVSAAYALGHQRTDRAIDPLLPFVDFDNSDVRQAVVFGLLALDDLRAINALLVLMEDSDLDVRNWATFGIGTQVDTDSDAIRAALLRRLEEENEDDEIRGEAMVGLARRKDTRVVPFLRRELEAGNAYCLTLEAATEIAAPSLYPVLVQIKDSGLVIEHERSYLADALEACRPSNAEMN